MSGIRNGLAPHTRLWCGGDLTQRLVPHNPACQASGGRDQRAGYARRSCLSLFRGPGFDSRRLHLAPCGRACLCPRSRTATRLVLSLRPRQPRPQGARAPRSQSRALGRAVARGPAAALGQPPDLDLGPQPSIEHQRRLPLRLSSRNSHGQLPQVLRRSTGPLGDEVGRGSDDGVDRAGPGEAARAQGGAAHGPRVEARRAPRCPARRPAQGTQRRVDGGARTKQVGQPRLPSSPTCASHSATSAWEQQVVATRNVEVDGVAEVEGDVAADQSRQCFHQRASLAVAVGYHRFVFGGSETAEGVRRMLPSRSPASSRARRSGRWPWRDRPRRARGDVR